MNKGAGLLVKTVKAVESGRYSELPQHELVDGTELKHAPKIFKEDCQIDWNNTTETVFNLIRGLSPIPTAFTKLNDKILKIYYGQQEVVEITEQPGAFSTDNKTYLKFAVPMGILA